MDKAVFENHSDFSAVKQLLEPAIENFKPECKHDNTIEEDGARICEDCGLQVEMVTYDAEWRYYGDTKGKDPSRCHKVKGNEKTIDKVVEKLHLPESIKIATEEKYRKVVGETTARGTGRKAIVAACLLHAYRDKDDIRTVDEIRNLFELSKKDISSGLTKYYEKFPEDRVKHIKPGHLIRHIMSLTGIHISHYRGILALTQYLDHTSSLLSRSGSQSTAAAIVYLYLCLNPEYKEELGLSKTGFAEKVKLSDITIIKLTKEALKIIMSEIEDGQEVHL